VGVRTCLHLLANISMASIMCFVFLCLGVAVFLGSIGFSPHRLSYTRIASANKKQTPSKAHKTSIVNQEKGDGPTLCSCVRFPCAPSVFLPGLEADVRSPVGSLRWLALCQAPGGLCSSSWCTWAGPVL
jgi:hypothetical protein